MTTKTRWLVPVLVAVLGTSCTYSKSGPFERQNLDANKTLNMSCDSDNSCAVGQACLNDVCVADVTMVSCQTSTDCPSGQTCGSNGVCTVPGSSGALVDATLEAKIKMTNYFPDQLMNPHLVKDPIDPAKVIADPPNDLAVKIQNQMKGKFWIVFSRDADGKDVVAHIPAAPEKVDGDGNYSFQLVEQIPAPVFPEVSIKTTKTPGEDAYYRIVFDALASKEKCTEDVKSVCPDDFDVVAYSTTVDPAKNHYGEGAGLGTPAETGFNLYPMPLLQLKKVDADSSNTISPDANKGAFLFGSIWGMPNCDSGITCELLPVLGGGTGTDKPCTADADCGEGSTCQDGKCTAPAGGKKKSGESCAAGADCESGSCTAGKCDANPTVGPGATCTPSCAAGETCTEGKCGKNSCTPKCDGTTCGDDSCGGQCTCPDKTYACTQEKKCVLIPVEKLANDAACTKNEGCQSNNCVGGKCVQGTLKQGEKCGTHSQCSSNNCVQTLQGVRGGTCQNPLKKTGESCSMNNQCESGTCSMLFGKCE